MINHQVTVKNKTGYTIAYYPITVDNGYDKTAYKTASSQNSSPTLVTCGETKYNSNNQVTQYGVIPNNKSCSFTFQEVDRGSDRGHGNGVVATLDASMVFIVDNADLGYWDPLATLHITHGYQYYGGYNDSHANFYSGVQAHEDAISTQDYHPVSIAATCGDSSQSKRDCVGNLIVDRGNHTITITFSDYVKKQFPLPTSKEAS